MRACIAAIIIIAAPAVAVGQHSHTCDGPAASMPTATFVACARAGTERYRDRATAIADGYRPVGRDFPAMGEHWIRTSLIFDGQFDVSRPEVLNYVVVEGNAALVGVGYAVPLLAGEVAPASPAGPHAWHDHFRTIHEETVSPHHHTPGQEGGRARLAMLHAWVWLPNPEGVFVADNWAIPFLRLGHRRTAVTPSAAAKALALATGGRDYFSMSIAAAAATGAAEQRAVEGAMEHAHRRVLTLLQTVDGEPGEAEVAQLATIWTEMWERIDAALAPAIKERLAALPIR